MDVHLLIPVTQTTHHIKQGADGLGLYRLALQVNNKFLKKTVKNTNQNAQNSPFWQPKAFFSGERRAPSPHPCHTLLPLAPQSSCLRHFDLGTWSGSWIKHWTRASVTKQYVVPDYAAVIAQWCHIRLVCRCVTEFRLVYPWYSTRLYALYGA